MWRRCASFNVLADTYFGQDRYGHVASGLFVPEVRLSHTLGLIANLQADVMGLQEVERPLADALEASGEWQLFWSPKADGYPDGCLMLVRRGIAVTGFETHAYQHDPAHISLDDDDLGHVMQTVVIGGVVFANTHIKWAPADDPHHPGVAQAKELLGWLGTKQPAVIFADCNDRPNGPVRTLIETAGFTNTCGNEPTALIGQECAALDLLAVRRVRAERIKTAFRPEDIPSAACPSDHIPVMAYVEID